jgi:hypothetical protein
MTIASLKTSLSKILGRETIAELGWKHRETLCDDRRLRAQAGVYLVRHGEVARQLVARANADEATIRARVQRDIDGVLAEFMAQSARIEQAAMAPCAADADIRALTALTERKLIQIEAAGACALEDLRAALAHALEAALPPTP